MKEDALKVALKQKPDEPQLISDKKEFRRAVKDHLLKDISTI